METFLQSYGSWIVIGLGFVLMLAMHGSHGGGHGQHTEPSGDTPSGTKSGAEPTPATGAAPARRGGSH